MPYQETLQKIAALGSGHADVETILRELHSELGATAPLASALYTTPFWEDLRFSASRGKQGQTEKPEYSTAEGGLLFSTTPEDILYMDGEQFPHAMVAGATIYPHIHVMQTQNLQAQFRLAYRVYDNNAQVPAAFTNLDSVGYAFTYVGPRFSNIIVFPPIDLGAAGVGGTSCMIDMRLTKTDAAYTGDILVKSFDIHIPLDRPGSREQYTK